MADLAGVELKSVLLREAVMCTSNALGCSLIRLLVVARGGSRRILASVDEARGVREALLITHFTVHQLLNVPEQLVEGHDEGRQNDHRSQPGQHLSETLARARCQAC